MNRAPKVFISYSWKSEEYTNSVLQLAERLRGDGVDVILDRWALRPGCDMYSFIENSIREADKVLILCEQSYVEKANKRKSGAGFESRITPALYARSRQGKIIPVFMESHNIVPDYLRDRIGIPFQNQSDEEYWMLLRAIFDEPDVKEPPLFSASVWLWKRASSKPNGHSAASPQVAHKEDAKPGDTHTITPDEYFIRAQDAEKAGRYEDAIADYSKAIILKPDYVAAYHNRGLIHHKLNNFTSALADFTKAVELNPDYESAYFNRAGSFFQIQHYEEAIADNSIAIKLKPNNSSAFYNRGVANFALAHYQDAIADYTKAIELGSRTGYYAYYNRGLAYSNLKQYSEALADFNKAIDMGKKDEEVYNRRGTCLYYLDRFDEAVESYSIAIELKPNSPDSAYYNRSLAYSSLKRYRDALADLDKAIVLRPNDRLPLIKRAEVYDYLSKEDRERANQIEKPNNEGETIMEDYEQNRTVFLSFCSKDKDLADTICEELELYPSIQVSRFENSVCYKGSFIEFMNGLKNHDKVIMIITDRYLKSRACLYEVSKLAQLPDYADKVLFVVCDEDDRRYYKKPVKEDIRAKIYSIHGRNQYFVYWQQECESLEQSLGNIKIKAQQDEIEKEIQTITNMMENIVPFFSYLANARSITFGELYKHHFTEFLKELGVKNS